MTTLHNLLDEPLIRIRAGSNPERVDLPTLFERLGCGDPMEFVGLQAHQQHAWHAFLVQLAALAIARTDDGEPGQNAGVWRRQLLDLTGGAPEPWCLAVGDLSKPAFMQPPVPEGSLAAFNRQSSGPHEIDILVTAKNHDVKAQRFTRPESDHWIYALVTQQTMEGYSGRGNNGIARMNGGFASRPALALAPSDEPAPRFRRDLGLLLERRSGLLESFGYANRGHALLWTLPWDGTGTLSPLALDPYFVEVCRRLRITSTDDSLRIHLAPSKAPRIDAKDRLGDLGDPWIPVQREPRKALTVSEGGFQYRLFYKLLFSQEYESPAAQGPRSQDGDRPVAIARVLARGQGKTGGYHERLLPMTPEVAWIFGQYDERLKLGELAEARVETVQETQRRVLRPALCALHQKGRDSLDLRDKVVTPWVDRLDREVDRVFFEHLFADIDEPEDVQLERWHTVLWQHTQRLFEEAVETLPRGDVSRYRAIASGESRLQGGARKVLTAAFPKPESDPSSQEVTHP